MEKPIESMTASVPSWGARLAFGEPIVSGDQQVVPAALVMFGFGGGGGSGKWGRGESEPEQEGEGTGGGGGGYVLPVGAYVTSPAGSRFLPNPVALIIASVPLVSAAGWALARIIAAWRSGRV